jgi:hypothetical protein
MLCLPPACRHLLAPLLLATALAAHAAPPGIWREVEQGEGHTRTQEMRQASGGKLVSNFDAGRSVTLVFDVAAAMADARLYLRYNNAMDGEGGVDAHHVPATGEPRLLGRFRQPRSNRWDEFRWTSLRVGPLPDGAFRVRLSRPPEIASGGLDVAVLVDDVWEGLWEPPGEFRNGQPVGTGRTLPPVALEVEQTACFTVLPAVTAPAAAPRGAVRTIKDPARWLGMNAGRGPIEEPIADFLALGLGATRSGGNNANPLDHEASIEALLAAGLEVHWVINYRGNGIDPKGTGVGELDRLDLNGPVMKAWFDNYKARCFAFFSAYSRPGHVRLRYYICGNEPDKRDNHTGLPGRPDVAVLLTRAMYEAALEVNPEELIVQSPPVAQPDSEYLREMILRHGVHNTCDVIGTHVYGNQTLDHRVGKPWEWLAEAGARRPVACTEAGVSVGWTPKGGDGREWQTDFMAHWYVKLRRMGYSHGILFTHDDDHHSDWAKLRTKGEIIQPNWDFVKDSLVPARAFRNGDFEEANDPRSIWVPDRNLDVPGWMERQITWQADDRVHEGRFSARFNVGGDEGPLAAYQLAQEGIVPGRPVTVRAMLRSNGPAARLSLNGYDPLAGAARVVSDPVTSPEWTLVSISVTPSNPWIVIGLLSEPGQAADAAVWFDDVRVE